MKKTSPAAMPSIYLDALKAAYARIQPAGADCENNCCPAVACLAACSAALLHSRVPTAKHDLITFTPHPITSLLSSAPTNPADDDQEVPADVQEFFSLSDRIAKTYAGFNSSGGCLLHCESQAWPPFIRNASATAWLRNTGFKLLGWVGADWVAASLRGHAVREAGHASILPRLTPAPAVLCNSLCSRGPGVHHCGGRQACAAQRPCRHPFPGGALLLCSQPSLPVLVRRLLVN